MTQEHRQEAWQKDYPGVTQAITSLREELIFADTDRLQTQSHLEHFRQSLAGSDLPTYLWETSVQKKLAWLPKQHARALQHFHRALKALQTAMPQPQTKSAKPEPLPLPQPEPPAPRKFFQTAIITTIDGASITKVEPTAAVACRKKLWDLTDYVARQFYFVDAIIPEPYNFVLTNNGVTSEPAERFTITYQSGEFERLCKRELETNSVHLLDGARHEYHRYEDLKENPNAKNKKEDPKAGHPRSVD
jgi:hypothetical protein